MKRIFLIFCLMTSSVMGQSTFPQKTRVQAFYTYNNMWYAANQRNQQNKQWADRVAANQKLMALQAKTNLVLQLECIRKEYRR